MQAFRGCSSTVRVYAGGGTPKLQKNLLLVPSVFSSLHPLLPVLNLRISFLHSTQSIINSLAPPIQTLCLYFSYSTQLRKTFIADHFLFIDYFQ